MRRNRRVMVVLTVVGIIAGIGCGGGEQARKPARAPSAAPNETTGASRSALTTTTSTTTTTGAALDTNATMASAATPPVSVSSAVMRVTTTKCDREATCNHIGTGKPFGDRDACVNEIGHDVVGSLSTEACPAGVDADRLSACVSELQAKSCSEGSEATEGSEGSATEGVPASCTREQLCVRSF
jgi:hypothetical protein